MSYIYSNYYKKVKAATRPANANVSNVEAGLAAPAIRH